MTNGAGSISSGPRPPEVSDEEKEVISEFKQPLNALVQNCTMLHNIIGPACIFLRQGLSQAQLVCMQKSDLIFSRSFVIKTPRLPFSSPCLCKPSWKLLSCLQLSSSFNTHLMMWRSTCLRLWTWGCFGS